jgi:hypothetical protein
LQYHEKFSQTALYVKADLRLGEKPCKSRQETEDAATSLVNFVCQSKNQDKSCELCVSKQKSKTRFSKTALYVKADSRLGEKPCK